MPNHPQLLRYISVSVPFSCGLFINEKIELCFKQFAALFDPLTTSQLVGNNWFDDL